MVQTLRPLAATGLTLFLIGCASTGDYPASAADHHVHIRSDLAAEDLPRVQLARGYKRHELTGGRQDAEDLLVHLDRHGIAQAAILSLGYMYGTPDYSFSDEYDRVRHENDFVHAQARRYPDRLVAFCGVNPAADYALAEVDRCAGLGVAGLKLHVANSDLDLDNEGHVQALAAVFARANAHGMAIVIHLRPRGPGYGPGHVDVFVDRLLSQAPDIPVQLAHLGGGGAADLATLRAMRHLVERLGPDHNLWFDLSGTFLRDRDAPGGRATRADRVRNRQFAARLVNLLGPERILFGSDYDSLEFAETLVPLRRLHGVEPGAIRRILSNRAPYLPALAAPGSGFVQSADPGPLIRP